MSLFIPITKVDIAQRLVYGTISEEVPDKTGEILDYASAKAAFQKWSGDFHAASDGKSLGNVRAMHMAVAAGKLTDIHYDDDTRRIDGVAKIVDDKEWNKVLEGVYTGFSIGGGYARRWPDPENPALMRYTPILSEVSLVDNPAVPTATFQVIKQDGSTELRKFESAPAAPTPAADAHPAGDRTARLLGDLRWLAEHAKAIGATGLLAHIKAITAYLDDMDAADSVLAPAPGPEKAAQNSLLAFEQHIASLQKRIAQLEAQPLPAKGALRAPSPRDARLEAAGEPARNSAERVAELMKAALANPIAM